MIRKATKDDVLGINALGENLHNNFSKVFHIESEIDSSIAIVLVSDVNKEINGYLYALDFGDNIDLLSIYVSPRNRNKNIATSLIKYLVDNYIVTNKTITLEVKDNNIEALSLYRKMGFVVVNTRKNYYEDSDAYIMKWGIK